jgi:hypothetical protein
MMMAIHSRQDFRRHDCAHDCPAASKHYKHRVKCS